MIDIHSHIIYGVDDGPSTVEQSMEMVEAACMAGVTTIIATPHLQRNLFESEMLTEHYMELLYRTRSIDMTLKLGYEVFMDSLPQESEADETGLTLNRTRYILFEVPLNSQPGYGIEKINTLRSDGFIPVFAHPERNRRFLRRYPEMLQYIKAGCFLQIDAASIAGIYGRNVKSFAKKMIKNGLVDFIASNAHCADDYKDRFGVALGKVKKWVGEENAARLLNTNATPIITNDVQCLKVLTAV